MLEKFMKPFGSQDFTISPIGLGTVKFGRNQQVKYPAAFDLPSDKEIADILATSRDLGINVLDTAPAYGNSEERLGAQLQGQRTQWVIVGKVGEEFIDGQSFFNFTPEYIERSIIRTLRRLKTDYLDVVMIHSNGNDLDIINRYGALDALNRLKSKGLIRATGMSTKTIDGGIAALKLSDSVMATYNMGYQEELPVIEFAREHNKGVLIKKALSSGHVCVNRNSDNPVYDSLHCVFSNPGISSVVIGTINAEHLRENVKMCIKALEAISAARGVNSA